MKVTSNKTDNSLVILIEGRIDTITAPKLEQILNEELNSNIKQLVFDFEKVEYMSSAGIRVLMVADKQMSRQGSMKVVNVNEEIWEILDMTGIVEILDVER